MASLLWAVAGLRLILVHLLLSALQRGNGHLLEALVLQILRVQQQLLLGLQHLNGRVQGWLCGHFVVASVGFAVLELVGRAGKPVWTLRIAKVHL